MGQLAIFATELAAWRRFTEKQPPETDQARYLAYAKRSLSMFRELRGKWRLRLVDPRHRRLLDELERTYAVELEHVLERLFWDGLRGVVAAWNRSFATEKTLKSERVNDPTLEQLPEVLRSELEPRLRALSGHACGAAAIRQEMENLAGESAARAGAMQAAFVAEWPERMSARLRERIAKLDEADAAAWLAEIAALLGPRPRVDPVPGESPRRAAE